MGWAPGAPPERSWWRTGAGHTGVALGPAALTLSPRPSEAWAARPPVPSAVVGLGP